MISGFSFRMPVSLSARIGHRAPMLLGLAVVAAIALGVQPIAATTLYLLGALALLSFVLVTWGAMRAHDRHLCEACVSSMPLNPSISASRRKHQMALAHLMSNPRYLVPYLVVLIGSNFLTGTAGRIGWAAVQATMIYLIVSYVAHRRLQPWCAWCSSGGGGSHREDAPEPTGPRDDVRVPA